MCIQELRRASVDNALQDLAEAASGLCPALGPSATAGTACAPDPLRRRRWTAGRRAEARAAGVCGAGVCGAGVCGAGVCVPGGAGQVR